MLLSDRMKNTSLQQLFRKFGLLFVLLCAPLLTACSFQPLYGSNSAGESVNDALKSVQIAPLPGRVGQRMRNELIYQVTNGGAPHEAFYRLEMVLRESEIAALVTSSGDSQGQIYRIDAQFSLVRLSDKKVVFKGNSHARAAYDKSFFNQTDGAQENSIFGNIRARIDAENRATRTLAEELKVRIATYLSTSA